MFHSMNWLSFFSNLGNEDHVNAMHFLGLTIKCEAIGFQLHNFAFKGYTPCNCVFGEGLKENDIDLSTEFAVVLQLHLYEIE